MKFVFLVNSSTLLTAYACGERWTTSTAQHTIEFMVEKGSTIGDVLSLVREKFTGETIKVISYLSQKKGGRRGVVSRDSIITLHHPTS